MDLNKELAIRAKAIAEKMMEVNDFVGARRFALKAQKLYADLENISEMLIVCEVHCVVGNKRLDEEMDWYGILQVDWTADKAKIKQQYKRLALQLHPERNRFPGAEAAFKIIRQAQRVILDKAQRFPCDADAHQPAPSESKIGGEHSKADFFKKEGRKFRKVNGKRRMQQKEKASKSHVDFSSSHSDEDRLIGGNRLADDSSGMKKPSGLAGDAVFHVIEKESNGCQQKSSEANLTPPSVSNSDLDVITQRHEYDESEFHDFDKDRDEGCFYSGQIWAIYATPDTMPRFYARIDKVLSPGFKLRITWLEPDPDHKANRQWVNHDFPAVCGEFKHGSSKNTNDHLIFSHLVHWEKGRRRNIYRIIPRKGETWVLYKNWHMVFKSNMDANREYEYEIVEILTDYAELTGAWVASLVKVDGFVSLFCRAGEGAMSTFRILPNQLFRFSHRVPSCKMTGNERDGVPKGSFELDPASVPGSICELGCS